MSRRNRLTDLIARWPLSTLYLLLCLCVLMLVVTLDNLR